MLIGASASLSWQATLGNLMGFISALPHILMGSSDGLVKRLTLSTFDSFEQAVKRGDLIERVSSARLL